MVSEHTTKNQQQCLGPFYSNVFQMYDYDSLQEIKFSSLPRCVTECIFIYNICEIKISQSHKYPFHMQCTGIFVQFYYKIF